MSAPAKAKKKYARQKRRAFKHGLGQVYAAGQRKWVWAFDVRVNGVRVSESGFATKEKAAGAVARLKLRGLDDKYGLPTEEPITVTLAELMAEREHDLNLKLKNGKRARVVLQGFVGRFAPRFSVTKLSAVHLRDYVKARHRELPTIAPETINKELGYISAALNAAPRMFEELADYRPPKMPWAKVSKRKRKRPITREEEYKLLMVLSAPPLRGENPQTTRARHDVADLFELALNTGMRGGEIVKLTWVQIDFESEQIFLGKTKNGEDRLVPMNRLVRQTLRKRRLEQRGTWVFPNPKGTGPRYNYLRTFRRVAEELKLPYGQKLEHGFTPHAARHTATTRMLQAGNDIATVQEVVGHSDRTMTLVYSHASAATRRRAVESLLEANAPPMEEKSRANRTA